MHDFENTVIALVLFCQMRSNYSANFFKKPNFIEMRIICTGIGDFFGPSQPVGKLVGDREKNDRLEVSSKQLDDIAQLAILII